jgi:hypothetical protein
MVDSDGHCTAFAVAEVTAGFGVGGVVGGGGVVVCGVVGGGVDVTMTTVTGGCGETT